MLSSILRCLWAIPSSRHQARINTRVHCKVRKGKKAHQSRRQILMFFVGGLPAFFDEFKSFI